MVVWNRKWNHRAKTQKWANLFNQSNKEKEEVEEAEESHAFQSAYTRSILFNRSVHNIIDRVSSLFWTRKKTTETDDRRTFTMKINYGDVQRSRVNQRSIGVPSVRPSTAAEQHQEMVVVVTMLMTTRRPSPFKQLGYIVHLFAWSAL